MTPEYRWEGGRCLANSLCLTSVLARKGPSETDLTDQHVLLLDSQQHCLCGEVLKRERLEKGR